MKGLEWSTYVSLRATSDRNKARENPIGEGIARIGKASSCHAVVHRTRSTKTKNNDYIEAPC
jgi:hypothetical protein